MQKKLPIWKFGLHKDLFFYENGYWVIDGWLQKIDGFVRQAAYLKLKIHLISIWRMKIADRLIWKRKKGILANSKEKQPPKFLEMVTQNKQKNQRWNFKTKSSLIKSFQKNIVFSFGSYLVEGRLGEIDWYGQWAASKPEVLRVEIHPPLSEAQTWPTFF